MSAGFEGPLRGERKRGKRDKGRGNEKEERDGRTSPRARNKFLFTALL